MENRQPEDRRLDADGFANLVRDALAHLYDLAYLRTHPLLRALVPQGSLSEMARVHQLRHLLLSAIEQLRPSDDLPQRSREWRPYLALRHYYVDGLELAEVEARLGLGDRQVLRERVRGLDTLVVLLQEQQHNRTSLAPLLPVDSALGDDTLSQEVAQIGVERALIPAAEFLESVCHQVEALAREHQVLLSWRRPMVDGPILVDATLLRQALVVLLTHGIQRSAGGQLRVVADLEPDAFEVTITGALSAADWGADCIAVSRALLEAQGASAHLVKRHGEGICVHVPQHSGARILIIDDNEGTLSLYCRFLAQEDYRVATAIGGEEGVRQARSQPTDLVVLDLMMRETDGWQVLQALRADPRTGRIPVIICSVLAEEALALSLGAARFLRKPVDRVVLIQTIAEVLGERHSEP